MRLAVSFVACCFLANAQYPAPYPGQYPPGQYPPGQYPPNTYPNTYPGTYPGPMGIPVPVPNIHLPKKKNSKEENTKISVQSAEGTLRHLAEKDLLLQTSPDRVLKFRLIARTEFLGKDGRPVRDSLLHPGDKLSVEANPDDLETALHVVLLRSGSGSDREAASVPVDRAGIYSPESSDFGKVHAVSESSRESDSRDADSHDTGSRDTVNHDTEGHDSDAPSPDSGSHAGNSHSDEAPDTGTGRPSILHQPDDPDARLERPVPAAKAPPMSGNSTGAIIDDAREAADSYAANLPNFLAEQTTIRYAGTRGGKRWR
ncbi:MAG: hypothetical protein KGN84_12720, partial [Acidobacteriota bacterium]|nr:hypothetical protein [Acidobacteriota bacterium]